MSEDTPTGKQMRAPWGLGQAAFFRRESEIRALIAERLPLAAIHRQLRDDLEGLSYDRFCELVVEHIGGKDTRKSERRNPTNVLEERSIPGDIHVFMDAAHSEARSAAAAELATFLLDKGTQPLVFDLDPFTAGLSRLSGLPLQKPQLLEAGGIKGSALDDVFEQATYSDAPLVVDAAPTIYPLLRTQLGVYSSVAVDLGRRFVLHIAVSDAESWRIADSLRGDVADSALLVAWHSSVTALRAPHHRWRQIPMAMHCDGGKGAASALKAGYALHAARTNIRVPEEHRRNLTEYLAERSRLVEVALA